MAAAGASRWTGVEVMLALLGALLVLCALSLVAFWLLVALPGLLIAATHMEPAPSAAVVAMVARLAAWRWWLVGGWLAAVGVTLGLVRSMVRPGVKVLLVGLVAVAAAALLLGLVMLLSVEPFAQAVARMERERW